MRNPKSLITWENLGIVGLLGIALYFVFFWNLDAISLRTYDESRQAVNALEMIQNGQLWVTYFDGKPDMWSTKPPLLIWLMAGFMQIVGYHELAVRLPSAIAASLVVIILFCFARYYLQDLKASFLAAFTLLTSYGFTGIHVARTGDFDALLTLWITFYFISYFIYLDSREKQKDTYLYLTAIFLGLAIFTKGIAALIPLPSLLLYTFYRKRLKQVFTAKAFYLSLVIVLIIGLLYYPLREVLNPGFLQAVIENEITGRYLKGEENIQKSATDYTYYLKVLNKTFFPWLYGLPIAFVLTQFNKNKQVRDLGVFSLIFLLFHLAVISNGQRKLDWYCAPQYPIAALLTGIGFSQGLELLLDRLKIQLVTKRKLISGFLIFGLLFLPSVRMVRNVLGSYQYERPKDPEEVQIGYYIRHLQQNPPDGQKLAVVDLKEGTVDGRRAHTLFYFKAANLNGFPLDFRYPDSQFAVGEGLITCFEGFKEEIEKNYEVEVVERFNACYTLKIKGKS